MAVSPITNQAVAAPIAVANPVLPDAAPAVATPAYVAPPIPELPEARAKLLAEQSHRILDGGTPRPDSRYKRPELILLARQAHRAQQSDVNFRNAQALQADALLRDKQEKDWYFEDLRAQAEVGGTVDEFITSYIAPVHRDTQTERDYVDLPESFLNVRRYQNLPGEGVYDVLPLKRRDRLQVKFVPLRGSMDSSLLGLFASGMEGHYAFFRRGTRVYLENAPGTVPVSTRFQTLELLLVIRSRKTGELPPPALLADAQDYDIIQRILKLALKVVDEDKVNDNNAKV